jgi:hypothetical protein
VLSTPAAASQYRLQGEGIRASEAPEVRLDPGRKCSGAFVARVIVVPSCDLPENHGHSMHHGILIITILRGLVGCLPVILLLCSALSAVISAASVPVYALADALS